MDLSKRTTAGGHSLHSAESRTGGVKRCKSRARLDLLKKPSLMSPRPAGAEQFGPVMSETNAQVYFRLVSGMILKEPEADEDGRHQGAAAGGKSGTG